MKFRDLFHLSWQNIRAQPKQHLILMVVVGTIFGVIFVANFYLQGIENTYQNLAGLTTNGKVLLLAAPNLSGDPLDSEVAITDAELAADVEQFGGKVASKIQRWNNEYGEIVLDAKYLQANIVAQYDDLPANTAPLLVNTNLGERLLRQSFPTNPISIAKHLEYYQRFRENLVDHTFTVTNADELSYYIVGLAPDDYHLSQLPLFDLFGELVESFPAPTAPSIIIDNPSLSQQVITTNSSLVIFENPQQAYQYLLHGRGYFMMVDLPDRIYQVQTIAGMSPEIIHLFQIKHLILNIFCLVLLVVAVIVIIFTSIRLIDQSQSTIQLYSNLGATTQQIRAIYLTYFFILMIGGLLLAFIIASIATVAYSLANQEMLSNIFQLGFSLADTPRVILWGINWEICSFMAVGLLASFLCILVNRCRLTR